VSLVLEFIGGLLADFLIFLFGVLFGPGFHAAGRLVIFLFTLGHVRIPPLRHGGGSEVANFGAYAAGLVFWVAAIALTIYLLVR
jgi:hypothetical protein